MLVGLLIQFIIPYSDRSPPAALRHSTQGNRMHRESHPMEEAAALWLQGTVSVLILLFVV